MFRSTITSPLGLVLPITKHRRRNGREDGTVIRHPVISIGLKSEIPCPETMKKSLSQCRHFWPTLLAARNAAFAFWLLGPNAGKTNPRIKECRLHKALASRTHHQSCGFQRSLIGWIRVECGSVHISFRMPLCERINDLPPPAWTGKSLRSRCFQAPIYNGIYGGLTSQRAIATPLACACFAQQTAATAGRSQA